MADVRAAMSGNWWDENIHDHKTYMRSYGDCLDTPSHIWTLEHILDGESLLDVGCGPGCVYENLLRRGRRVTYRGLDTCRSFVEACREMFPQGDFRFGDALALDETDGSWDTVLLRHVLEHTPGYEIAVREAMRVARKRVIVVKWRPLYNQDDKIEDKGDGGYCSDYNKDRFVDFLRSFQRPIEYAEFGGGRPNWGWIVYEVLDRCVFDLDDLQNTSPALDILFGLKKLFPNLKVTLFAILGKSCDAFLHTIARNDWIRLAVHGWDHERNDECKNWTVDETHLKLSIAEEAGCFVKGFRGPGWVVSDGALEALAQRGYWVAVQPWDEARARRYGLKCYVTANHPHAVHGHMQDINLPQPAFRNGLWQLVHERGLPFDGATQFQFVEEVIT